ncbi:uncharacterized protein METZ01_LOCUS357700, partial [marine metagenome]
PKNSPIGQSLVSSVVETNDVFPGGKSKYQDS